MLSVSERFEPLAREKQLHLKVKLPADPLPRCRCDEMRIEQLLTILTDNALSYTPVGGEVILAAELGKRSLLFTVTDTGPGIPDKDKSLIFQRFYRIDSARNTRAHYGLGLSIAKEISLLHKGTLAVSNAPSGGALFTLSLPL